ncbi:MAG: efflux RND transporter periplasmic adaptor subunit [Spirochaetaceae bacterium]|nr:efflux RND transporter periplasmic adaptor subunit [Spirochaetaceae bacterium]
MRKRATVLLVIGIIIISALVALSIYMRQDAGSGQGRGRGRWVPTVFAVESARSTRGDLADFVRINGNIEPVRQVDIFPDVAGRLSRLAVTLGDSVSTGQVLAEIDPSRPGLSFSLNPVRSTITGTITALPHEVGATISLASVVATVGDLSLLQIRTEVPEQHVGKVRVGTRAEVSFVAWPGRVFNTRIVEISPIVSTLTRTTSVRLEFDRNYPELMAGMFASIKLFTETRRDVVLIPSAAVVRREGRTFVFVVQDDKAVLTQVYIGLSVDGITEIISGLPVDTEIVVRGQNLLDDGVDVNVLNRERTDRGSD